MTGQRGHERRPRSPERTQGEHEHEQRDAKADRLVLPIGGCIAWSDWLGSAVTPEALVPRAAIWLMLSTVPPAGPAGDLPDLGLDLEQVGSQRRVGRGHLLAAEVVREGAPADPIWTFGPVPATAVARRLEAIGWVTPALPDGQPPPREAVMKALVHHDPGDTAGEGASAVTDGRMPRAQDGHHAVGGRHLSAHHARGRLRLCPGSQDR